MRVPSAGASTPLWVRLVLYSIARLTRDRTARPLVEIIQPALDALEAASAATNRAERALMIARAGYDGADDDEDEVTRQFQGELFLFVGKDPKAPLYVKCFPKGLTAVTGARIPDEVRLIKTLEGVIARELPGQEFATRLLARITAAREEMERQIPLFQKTVDDLAAAWAAELSARHDVRRQYRIVFAELVKLFTDNMRKVNSFFRDPGTARSAAVDADDATEETPPPPASTEAGTTG